MGSIESWVEEAAYAKALGVRAEHVDEDRVVLSLPYDDRNSNPGQALHGGVAASLGVIGSGAIARAALGESSGPWHTCSLQVSYLAAAIGEDVNAEARILRRGKELCFVDVEVRTSVGKAIARVGSVVRGRFGAIDAKLFPSQGDDGSSDPGPMGRHIGGVPFIGNRGIVVENMTAGRSRLVMPWDADQNGDGAGLHEGAAFALLDTTGAMAAWAETGPGRFKASTPSMQAQILAPVPAGDLVAFGRVEQRDGDIFWTRVEVASGRDRRVYATGTVLYRIVV